MSEYLSWSNLAMIKHAITNELIEIGVDSSLDKWKEGKMAYDILEFNKNDQYYHMFVSCRKGTTFGFGTCKLQTTESLFNETILFDDMFKIKIRNLIRTI